MSENMLGNSSMENLGIEGMVKVTPNREFQPDGTWQDAVVLIPNSYGPSPELVAKSNRALRKILDVYNTSSYDSANYK